MLPNRRWRRHGLLAPMGRSDLDGIEPFLDALDETYSSWMRDIRLAKGRIIVGDSMLDDRGAGRGATFDPDREAYAVVEGAMAKDVPITLNQFAIRVQEHSDTAREFGNVALRHAGYASISLGEVEGGQALTATEVKARGQMSWVTRDRKILYWLPRLQREALPALLAVDALAFNRPAPALDLDVDVEFADGVAEDLITLANTVEVLNRAAAASTETKVRIVHPSWGDDEVREEVALIHSDAAPPMAAPFDFGDEGAPTETDDQRAALDDEPDEQAVPAA
jgi:hypothetical protein